VRQKELFKEEIIHQLELHPSRLDKEKIISEAMEQGLDDFFEGIRMALDPLVTFGVKIIPENFFINYNCNIFLSHLDRKNYSIYYELL